MKTLMLSALTSVALFACSGAEPDSSPFTTGAATATTTDGEMTAAEETAKIDVDAPTTSTRLDGHAVSLLNRCAGELRCTIKGPKVSYGTATLRRVEGDCILSVRYDDGEQLESSLKLDGAIIGDSWKSDNARLVVSGGYDALTYDCVPR